MCHTFRSQLPALTYTGVTDSKVSLCLALYTSQPSVWPQGDQTAADGHCPDTLPVYARWLPALRGRSA